MKAIVLSGGGSKGSYQIGVWKALRKLHIKYDIVTGTSVGALNGALMVQNKFHKAIKLWSKINMELLFGDEATNSTKIKDVLNMYRINFFKNGGWETIDLEIPKSMQHILSDYKRVLKENEEVHKENEHLHREINRRIKLKIENEKIVDTQFISIQKIKDKIKHYQELQDNYIKKYDEINEGLQAMINVLQELL